MEPYTVSKVGVDPDRESPVGPRPQGETYPAEAEIERRVPGRKPSEAAPAPAEEGKALEPRAETLNPREQPGEEELAAFLALSGKDVRRLVLLLLLRDRVKAELDELLPKKLQA